MNEKYLEKREKSYFIYWMTREKNDCIIHIKQICIQTQLDIQFYICIYLI